MSATRPKLASVLEQAGAAGMKASDVYLVVLREPGGRISIRAFARADIEKMLAADADGAFAKLLAVPRIIGRIPALFFADGVFQAAAIKSPFDLVNVAGGEA